MSFFARSAHWFASRAACAGPSARWKICTASQRGAGGAGKTRRLVHAAAALRLGGAREAQALVRAQQGRDLRRVRDVREDVPEHGRVLDLAPESVSAAGRGGRPTYSHGGALRAVREHGVARVAEERDAPGRVDPAGSVTRAIRASGYATHDSSGARSMSFHWSGDVTIASSFCTLPRAVGQCNAPLCGSER